MSPIVAFKDYDWNLPRRTAFELGVIVVLVLLQRPDLLSFGAEGLASYHFDRSGTQSTVATGFALKL